MPFISAVIGWGTNYLAVKMLFRPYREKRFVFAKIHGVIPKRQEEIAVAVGEAVERDLLSSEDIEKMMVSIGKEKVQNTVSEIVDEKLKLYKLNCIGVVDKLHKKTLEWIKEYICREALKALNEKNGLISFNNSEHSVAQMVASRIKNFSTAELEKSTIELLNKELKFIEYIGALIGFMVGIVQVGILMIAE